MNLTKKIFKLLVSLGFILILFVIACVNRNETNTQINQINQIEYTYPARSHNGENSQKIAYDVFDLVNVTPCGTGKALLSPESLNISESEYQNLWRSIPHATQSDRFYKFTYGQCIEDGILVLNIAPCTVKNCAKEYVVDESILWLGTWTGSELPRIRRGDYTEIQQEDAPFFISLPIEPVPEHNAWQFKLMYTAKPDTVAMVGYLNSGDFGQAHFILGYQAFYQSGNLYSEGIFDNQGKQQGEQVYYYDEPGKIERRLTMKDDHLHGEVISYHENGQIKEKQQYNNGTNITKNGVAYDQHGGIQKKYSYDSAGSKIGSWLEYYANGNVKTHENYIAGHLTGNSVVYWENGQMKAKTVYKNNRHISEEKWFENGKKSEEQHYTLNGKNDGDFKTWHENGKLRTLYRYKQGELYYRAFWDIEGRLEYKETYKNGKSVSVEDKRK